MLEVWVRDQGFENQDQAAGKWELITCMWV
jgi:hypothetical protein